MKKISYFSNNKFYKSKPKNKEYLTIFSFVPSGGRNSIDNIFTYFKKYLDKLDNIPTRIVLVADDEGIYGSYLNGIYTNDFLEFLNEWVSKIKNIEFYFISHNLISDKVVKNRNLNYIAKGIVFHSEKHLNIQQNYSELVSERFENNLITNLFLSYNRSFRPHRFYLYYKLVETKLINSGLFFWHASGYNKDYTDMVIRNFNERFNLNILNSINITEEYYSKKFDNEVQYGQDIIQDDYEKTFLSLVSETESGNDTVYFSEKIFKPIVTLHPFILVGSPNSLVELKKLGYKTFDKWWDESYDKCDNPFDRIEKICDVLEKLNKLSYKELFDMRLEMRNVLEHNYKNFQIRIKKDYLVETLNEIFIDN